MIDEYEKNDEFIHEEKERMHRQIRKEFIMMQLDAEGLEREKKEKGS